MTTDGRAKPHHWPPCNCVLCLDFKATCKCCDRTFTTYPGYQRHLKAKTRQKRGAKTPPTAAIVPDGLGFLKRITASATNLGPYNLSVISRFCAALNEIRPRGAHAKFTRLNKRLQDDIERGLYTDKLLDFSTRLTEDQATAVLGLARPVNVSPGDVIALLVSYGLEHLAAELRANSAAPPVATPNIAKKIVTPVVSASEQYLQEKYPDVAKEVKRFDHTEYRRAVPSQAKKSFPSREGEDV